MSRRRIAVAGVAAIAAGAAFAVSSTAGASPLPGFAAPVLTDPFHPGYEPDVAIDKSPGHAGRSYVTWPNGFSTTVSYILRSDDSLHSFHPIEFGGPAGKPLSCPGGGDTDTQINNADGEFFFADLQGLTNFSNAVSKDGGKTLTFSCTAVPGGGVDRQWIAIDNNGGKSSVGGGATDGRAYFTYDNVGQDQGNNQLVVNETKDGYNYGGGAGCATPGVNCVAPPAVITDDEGIPGNMMVDNTRGGRFQHTVYVPHSDSTGNGVKVDYCRPSNVAHTAAGYADACSDPTQFNPSDTHRINTNWHDIFITKNRGNSITGFVTLAIDTKGGVYATWASYPGGTPNGPGAVYLSHSVDGGVHWSAPVTVSAPKTPHVVFPWIAAGDAGRVDIAYYGATQQSYKGHYGPDTLDDGTWDVYLAQSTDALSAHPHFHRVTVSDHHVKYGNISTAGLGGSPDRSLGDYLEVQSGLHGEAVVSYVDDTSANRNKDVCMGCGQTPAEAAGPTMVAVQTSGPSLYTSVGSLHGPLDRPVGSITDPVGKATDAFVATGSQDIAAPRSLDIKAASVTRADAGHLRVTLTTADANLAKDLQVSPSLGGTTADWIVRWAAPQYHHAGDGNMFYVGMESTLGQVPTFYTGSTTGIATTHTKYFVYGHDKAIPGSIKGSTITWTVPNSAIDSPGNGQGLYSITGFTSVQPGPTVIGPATPQSGNADPYSPPNLVDATSPFTYIVGGATAANGVALGNPLRGGLTADLSAVALMVLAGVAGSRSRRGMTPGTVSR